MKKFVTVFVLTVCAAAFAGDVIPLGTMDGFYRYTPVLGPALEGGYQVMEMPGWMQETDFPYMKKPFDQEIPFADGLSVVRLLSAGKKPEDALRTDGWGDLVIRTEDGSLEYRWALLKNRLDPYINLGYTDLTLVMDNIPWCFPETPTLGEYGQKAPPSDYREWYAFMKAMCVELKRLYGAETVKNFRFRMGTEMQDERRWIGGFDGYWKYYSLAAKAVKEEIPEAGFGPFNRSLPVPQEGQPPNEAEKVSVVELARHCAEKQEPFDFMARSFYYFSSQSKPGVFGNIHPDQRVPEIKKLWDELERITGTLSREIHEFSPHLSTEEGLYSPDTGARGAAQTFETLVALREAGAARIWHWHLVEKITSGKYLFYSASWLYSILDHMRGGQAFVVPVKSLVDHGNSQQALISVQGDRAILVVSNWNVDRVKQALDQLVVSIPKGVLPNPVGRVKSLSFTEETSVYDMLRRDLAEADLLSEKHKSHRGSPAASFSERGFHCMVGDKNSGQEFVKENWGKYEQLMCDALTLSDFTGSIDDLPGELRISVEVENPSVTVVVINFSSDADLKIKEL